MRLQPIATLVLLLALSYTGCDTVGGDERYTGIVEVSLARPYDVTGPALALVAVEDQGCDRGLVTSLETGAGTRRVEVKALGPPTPCRAIIPAAAIVPLDLGPELPGGYAVEVEHAGTTDLYSLDLTGPAPVLTAVRTSTTRLAE